jgi:UPF0271 protein
LLKVDLNPDLGEGYGAYATGDDASDADYCDLSQRRLWLSRRRSIMARTFRIARENGVSVGAHPGFPDLWGFGRRRMPFSTNEIERIIAYQIGAAQALAAYTGHQLTHVKAHGALGNISRPRASMWRIS